MGQEIIKNYYIHSKIRYFPIKFYKTLKPNPIFFDEEDVGEIGQCVLDLGKEYSKEEIEFYITMRIGGTFIDVKAQLKISGNYIKTKLDFN